MSFGLWVFTVLCVAIAIIFGLVSSIFAIINTVMTPIEVISGMQGLYLWNGMGGNLEREMSARILLLLLLDSECMPRGSSSPSSLAFLTLAWLFVRI